MSVTFALADLATRLAVDAAMRKHCPRLAEADVAVGVIFASSDKEDVPALQRKGAKVAATMQVVSLKDRVLKRVDAQMVINKQAWDELSEKGRRALAHHELLHIDLAEWKYVTVLGADGRPQQVVDEKTGEVVTKSVLEFERDDLGRPKLKSVHGDIDIGDGFEECVREYGEESLEWQSLTQGGRWADGGLEKYWERLRERAKGPPAGEREADDFGPDSPFAGATITYTNEAGEVVTREGVDLTRLKTYAGEDAGEDAA